MKARVTAPLDRRAFLARLPLAAASTALACGETGRREAVRTAEPESRRVQTALGPVTPGELGVTLMHEHVLVDFVGADRVSRDRYDAGEAFEAILPHLAALPERGCRTLVECTPAYLGRDPALLRRLSEASGVTLVTNTGYYGAAEDAFVPPHAFEESAETLAARWTREAREGLDGTEVRPGFMKIGVDPGPLSEIDRKLVEAAARCHLATGLSAHVHTGDGVAAFAILAVLEEAGVAPTAYVWVHAQNEPDRTRHVEAAARGAWIELDGIGPETLESTAEAVAELAEAGHLGRTLVSQDAGWYHVGEPGGGSFRPFTLLFDEFLPLLRARGFDDAAIRTLLVDNPAALLGAGVRAL